MVARNDANQRKTNSSMWQSVCVRFRGALEAGEIEAPAEVVQLRKIS